MDPKFTDAIEACRPNHDDLELPELQAAAHAMQADSRLREFRDQIKAVDVQITDAMKSVDAPDGLEDRILAKLQNEPLVSSESGDASRDVTLASPSKSLRRSRWAIYVTACMFIAGSVALVMVMQSWPDPLNENALSELAASDIDQLSQDAWVVVPKSVPKSSKLRSNMGSRYQKLADVHAFQLSGEKRFLLVRKAKVASSVPRRPPTRPVSRTNGWLFGSWQEEGYVYTLAVQGTVHDYQALIKRDEPLAYGGRAAFELFCGNQIRTKHRLENNGRFWCSEILQNSLNRSFGEFHCDTNCSCDLNLL